MPLSKFGKRKWEASWQLAENVDLLRSKWGDPRKPVHTWNKEKLKRLKPVLEVKGDSVLDVGCGLGHGYALLRHEVHEYVGVDFPVRVKACQKMFPEGG